MEETVPGITRGLKDEEIHLLLHISERLLAWTAAAKARYEDGLLKDNVKKHYDSEMSKRSQLKRGSAGDRNLSSGRKAWTISRYPWRHACISLPEGSSANLWC